MDISSTCLEPNRSIDMGVSQMRETLISRYPNSAERIKKMPDSQVIAFYNRAIVNSPKKQFLK